MSKLAVLLLLAGFGSAACAAACVTVEQVEQLLSASRGLPDVKLAARISDLELNERASSLRLSRWEKDFPGKHTREALLALVDASAFLELPSSDIPAIEKPDAETRKQIFLRAIEYSKTTIHRLPDFSARRSTTHFDDVSPIQKLLNEYLVDRRNGHKDTVLPPGALAANGSPRMRIGERSSIVVTYRDGHEVVDGEAGNHGKSELHGAGLTTFGEFGPILSVVIADITHGKLYWGHWEQGATGLQAVFRYEVPQEISHYTVLFRAGEKPQTPAYHGEIAVDPANGTILRVALVSQLIAPEAVETSTLVEYSSVAIGNGTYICPVRGVALSRVPGSTVQLTSPDDEGRPASYATIPPQTLVNDVSFTEYHVFHGDVRVLP